MTLIQPPDSYPGCQIALCGMEHKIVQEDIQAAACCADTAGASPKEREAAAHAPAVEPFEQFPALTLNERATILDRLQNRQPHSAGEALAADRHSPEPWKAETYYSGGRRATVYDSERRIVLTDWYTPTIECDQERIVACINYCEGIPTSHLVAHTKIRREKENQ